MSALYMAVENENIEIIKILVSNKNLDINCLNVFKHFFYKIVNQLI